MEHVFEPFFTTKEVGKGSGLGLSQVFGFMRQSGGYVRIYSEPGTGTSVRLYLPRPVRERDRTASEVPPARVPHARQGEVVLAVEDKASLRRVLVTQLGELGYTVLEADTGASALEILRLAGRIDLLLTDIVMPGGMNGHELAQRAAAVRPDLKVLYTSGFPNGVSGHGPSLKPGDLLLSKPYRRDELAQSVRAALAA